MTVGKRARRWCDHFGWLRGLACAGVAMSALTFGCTGPPFIDNVVGVRVNDAPGILRRDVFLRGERMTVVVDLNRFPSKAGRTYYAHVVPHRSAAEWADQPALLPAAATRVGTANPSGSSAQAINALEILTESLPASGPHRWHQAFDLVLDFNTNGLYDPDVDIIDRLGLVTRLGAEDLGGFTVVDDPQLAGDFPTGQMEYDFGSWIADPPQNAVAYWEDAAPVSVALKGRLHYPTTPLPTDLRCPLVIMAHGRHNGASTSYQGYDYIGRHLASRGFICASIDLSDLVAGWRIAHRAVTVLRHIEALLVDPLPSTTVGWQLAQLREHVDTSSVGLLGHSRGGEAVVAAQRLNDVDSPFRIKAVAALAPTDGGNFTECTKDLPQSIECETSGPWTPTVPYCVLYGSRDGDISGLAGNTGIRTYDRAPRPRHLAFIYGANHNYFNTTWGSDLGGPFMAPGAQRAITSSLLTAFFHCYLLDQAAYGQLLSGEIALPAVKQSHAKVVFSSQPDALIRLIVDSAEELPPALHENSLGEKNALAFATGFTGQFYTLAEEPLRYSVVPHRNYYAHDTRGLRLQWTDANDLSWNVDVGERFALFYDSLSFRIGQKYRSGSALRQDQSIGVSLIDAWGNESPVIPVSVITPILYPDERGLYTKSVMQSVRVPIRAFVATSPPIDLTRVVRIRLAFEPAMDGALIFDDIEFTGFDLTYPERQ